MEFYYDCVEENDMECQCDSECDTLNCDCVTKD